MDTAIVHMDLDTFFVSAEILRDSSLKGKPVIIGGGSSRAVVASCSYEARKFGVRSAMPVREALRLCPMAVVRKGDIDYYSKLSRDVTDVISESAPLFEKASIDEHYLDVSGMDKFFGSVKWTHELRRRITDQTGLPISFGLSVNKTVSKIATNEAKKKTGELVIAQGEEKPFLAPLPSSKIPGIGPETYTKLCKMGAPMIRNIQLLMPELLEAAFGKPGVTIWHKANGIDNSLVIPYHEQKSMSRSVTFEQDTTDMELLRKTIISFVDELAFELRSQQRLTCCITITIRYANWDTHTRQTRIAYSCTDDILCSTALQLFEKLYDRRMLIRLIGVKFSDFVTGSYQIDLFNDNAEVISLCQAIDGIRRRFGHDSLVKAITIE
ncbi:DNA polymerase IV [Chitinophaga sp. CC14]|uniref:DNA polymerase Y family protein n=1 Tax=Chitinophaga sp. CC14 TaxID=3029199 RepID=UPI003B7ADD6C